MATDLTESRAAAPAGPAGGDARLSAILSRAEGHGQGGTRGLPPVERWEPAFCGDIDMEIRADGSWFYMGTPIGRERLVRLFSTVLRKDEDGDTYLVTPVEKVRIRVEDAPFLAVEMAATGGDGDAVLTFRTNVGDMVEAGPDHRLRFEVVGEKNELKPYLHVRGRLEALVSRALAYDLVERAETLVIDGTATLAIRSKGEIFPIMPAAQLDGAS